MAVIIIIALVALAFVGLVLWFKHYLFISNLYWHFKHVNVIIFGKKGTGKDVITQNVINHRKDFYYANIPYTEDNYELIDNLNKVSCMPNTYEKIVNNDIIKSDHLFKEGKDIYISDIGIYLPSYMDNKLYNKFPSMPIIYALSRQLYGNNIHCNSQNLERAWKALREQADFYVKAVRTYNLPFMLVTKVITYDKYESAKQNLLPIKTRLLNKYSKSQVDIYNATNGDIRQGLLITWKKDIHYDTRYFETKLLKGERV